MSSFDPNGPGLDNGNLIGLPFSEAEASVVLLPVPWDVTVSYRAGTAGGPDNIRQASTQLDLEDQDIPDAWKLGIHFLPTDQHWAARNGELRARAEAVIQQLEATGSLAGRDDLEQDRQAVNQACRELRDWVRKSAERLLDNGKLVGLIGGDHSTPHGLLEALNRRHDSFGILQIDAHMDLREAYEGFTFSHASIFFNALKLESISQLVQVGIRDYCAAEKKFASIDGRVKVFYDHLLSRARITGASWQELCDSIIRALPQKVYVSFDIDGLDPKLCPHTGTPVPGGIDYPEVDYLLRELVRKGRTIIGFDLCETAGAPHEWDANVAARLTYLLSNLMAVSNGVG